MEGRKKSGSGIGRIFSLSLNQALSGKQSPHPCNAPDRSSSVSASPFSEEEKLGDGNAGQPCDRPPAAHSRTRRRSTYRQSSSVSVKKKADVGSEELSLASRDSHKISPRSNTSSSDGKRKTDYCARKDSPRLDNGISTSSSSRTADSSSPSSAPDASPQLLAAETCENKDQHTSPGSVSLQSQDASPTHSHCEELENTSPAGNSTQTDSSGGVHQKGVSGNGESSGTLRKPTSGSVPKDSALEIRGHSRAPSNPSGAVDSQKCGSSLNALGSHASLLKSKSISDRQKYKPQNNRNCCRSEKQISPKTYQDTRDNHKKSVSGKAGSSDRGCFKPKSPKRRENRGPRDATSSEWESGQFSGKRRNRFQNTGYRNAHTGAHLGSDSAVSTNNRNRRYPCPPKKTPLPSDSTSKGSTERRKENLKDGSQRSEGSRVVNESVEAPQNVSGVGGIGVPNADSSNTSCPGHRERCGRMVPRTTGSRERCGRMVPRTTGSRERCGRMVPRTTGSRERCGRMVPRTTGRSTPALDTTGRSTPVLDTTTGRSTPALDTTTGRSTPALDTTTGRSTPALDTTGRSTPVLDTTTGRSTPVLDTTGRSTPALDTTTGRSTPALDTTTGRSTPALDTTTGRSTPALDTTTGRSTPALDTTTGRSTPALDTTTGRSTPALDTTTGRSNPALDTTTGRSTPALDTGHLDSSVSVSSPVAGDENSGKPDSNEAQNTETFKQEDTLATQSKKQTPSQVESKEKPRVEAGSFKMNDSAEVLSNSDKSEVEVWFDVKDDMNKEDCGTDIVQLEGSSLDDVSAKKIDAISAATTSANSPLGKDASSPSPDMRSKAEPGDSVEHSKSPSPDMRSKADRSDSVENSKSPSPNTKSKAEPGDSVENSKSPSPDMRSKADRGDSVENSTECDAKIGQARSQAVSIAQMRQASVATRMRGNRRLKLGINRMNVNGKDMKTPEASEGQGVNLEGNALLKFDEDDLGNDVGDGVKARQKNFVETTKQQTNGENPADHVTEEEVVKECLPEDNAQSVAERNGAKRNKNLCVHGHLEYVSECCKKDGGSITKEVLNSVAGPKPMPETNTEQEEQLAHRKRGLNCEIAGVSVCTQSDQDTAQLDNFKATVCVKYSHEEIKNTALKEPVPLLSLQPRPTAHLFYSAGRQPVFASGEGQDCSSDSCLPVNQHCAPLKKSRAGFSRKKERSGSIGSSSSSHPPLSSINSQSQKCSVSSGTSHTSLSSDDSKDAVAHKRGLSKQRADGRVAGLRRECFSNNGKFIRSERYSFVEKSHCPVALGSQHADSKKTKESETFGDLSILSCSKVSMFEDQEKQHLEAAAPITQLASKTVMGSQSQHCKIQTWERNETTHGFTDEFEETGRQNLSVLSFQNDSKSLEHADGIAHESSTDTVTESTQDIKLQCVSSTAEKAESVNSLDSNWDSDILVINSGDSSEPVPFYDQLDADSKIILEYDNVNTVSVQLPATECLQWSRTRRSGKHRQGLNAPEKQDRHSNVDVDTHRKLASKKQITGNKHSLEVYDTGNGDWISGSKFSNKWNNSFVVRETGVAASEVTSVKQLARKSESDKNKQSCGELSYARLQEQKVGHMVQSTSGSECSESVSLFSDGLSAGPDLFLKEREYVDHRCRNWVKKTRAWPAKTNCEGEADSQTDNSNCGPSCRFPLSEGPTGAGQKHHVWGEEVWRDSNTAQPQGTPSFILEGAPKKEGLTEGKPHSHATHRHQPKHWQSESGQYHRERVLQEAVRRSWAAQDSDAAQAAASQVEKECGSSKTKSHQSHRGEFSKTKSHQSHRGDFKNKSNQSHRGDLKTKSQQSHRDDSSKTKWHQRHQGDSSKRKSQQSHREADDSRGIFRPDDRELAQAHARDDSRSLQKCVSSDTGSLCSCGEHRHHCMCDVGGSKRRTSGSTDCDIAVLSQSDWEDLSAGSPVKPQGAGIEAEWRRPCAAQSYQANAANKEHWHDLCPGQPYYPPYPSPSHPQSYYAPYHPETDLWVPAHHPYYSQWYNAWMAYSMGCYGYSFQDRDPGMDCQETSHGQNCCSSPACHHQHSQPPSQPPPPPLPLSLVNPSYPSYPDPRGPYDVSSTQSQSSDAGGKRNGDRSEDNDMVSVPSSSGQDVRSTQYRQDGIKKEPADAVGRPITSVEMPKWKEDRDSKLHQGGNSPSCRNMKNESVDPETSRRPCATNEFNHTAALGEYPVNVSGRQGDYPMNGAGRQGDYSVTNHPVDGRQFFRCHFRPTQPTAHPPGSIAPNCRGDFKPWPGFRCPPGFRIPSPLMHLDPFRFYTPPRYYPAFTPQQASAYSPHGGQEEGQGSPPCEKHQAASEQLPIPDMADQFHRDASRDWNPQTQQSAPLMSACAPPPPPPPPPAASAPPSSSSAPTPVAPSSDFSCPGVRETTSQTSVDTMGSEPCRLDSSFDTRGAYDASSSDQGEASGGEATAISKRKCSTMGDGSFGKFVAAQRERYLQMRRDSGSEDPDSSSLPSSKQSNVAKMSSDQEENNSSGSGAVAKPWGRGVVHSLHRRAIPFSSHNRLGPPAQDSIPGATYNQGAQCSRKSSPWASGLLTPPAGLSYGQAVAAPGGWWDGQPDAHLYQEDYPSLSASSSSPSSQTVASQGSGAEVPSKSVAEKVSCKGFFRKPWREAPGAFRGSRWPLSGYASRLLSDSRLSAHGGSKGGMKAFSKAYHTKFVDTHCHLDFLFNREPYKGSFASYRENKKSTFPDNYECCVAVFCKPKSFRNESKWKPLVEEDGVWMAMGCHPKNATEYTKWAEVGLREALTHKKTVALGEIGLDYSKHYGNFSAQQKDVFIRQIGIALEMKLPLVIHCREAEDDCLEILEKHVPADYKIHCHCFTANYASATKWLSRFSRLFIGLTPLVTYRTAVDTHQVATLLPLDKLLLETDAPYFFPSGMKGEGKLSHPGMALTVAIRVAELRGIPVEDVLVQVRQNTKDMYGI